VSFEDPRLFDRNADKSGGSLIEYINQHEGVEWMTFGEMAKEFLEGRIEGATIEGGADP